MDLYRLDTNDEPDIYVRTRHTFAITGLAPVTDANGNGAPELAALRVLADGTAEVTIKHSTPKALINSVTFPNTDRVIRGLASLPDIAGGGSPEVAVLFCRHSMLPTCTSAVWLLCATEPRRPLPCCFASLWTGQSANAKCGDRRVCSNACLRGSRVGCLSHRKPRFQRVESLRIAHRPRRTGRAHDKERAIQSPGSDNADPSAAAYAGDRPAQIARRLFHATRPKFFPASILPVLAGTAWGVASGGSSDAAVFLLALLATACVHAGVNVLNDVGDDAGGTDRINQERIYPYTGGSGFIQEGNLSAAAMARLGITLLVVAAISGLVLLLAKGAVVLWFGVAGVALALMYFAAVVTTWLCVAGRLPLLAPLVPVGLPVLAARAAAAIRRGPCRSSMTHGIEATLAIPTIGAVGLTGSAQYLALFSRG